MKDAHRVMTAGRRVRLRGIAVTATILVTVAVAGCGSGNNDNASAGSDEKAPTTASGSLTVSIYTGLSTMDPFQAAGSARTPNEQLMRHVYEGLVALDDNVQVIPMLAESYEVSPDGKTYTFKLRKGVKFHKSGKEMDANDVVYSLNYFKQKGVQGYSWPALASVKAVDPSTVRIDLEKPSGGFLQQLASPDIVPIVAANSADNNGLATADDGTGPYQISNFVANTSATLKPFAGYASLTTPATGFGGAKKALISTLTFRVISNPATASAAFRTGEVGAIIRPAQQDVKALDAQPNLKIFNVPGTLVVDVDINPKKAPLDNPKVRQAVAYALDRNAIFQAAGQGFGELRDVFSPTKQGATWFGDAPIPKWPYDYDVNKAKQLVQESGYDGKPIEIIIGPTTYMPPAATVIQQQLKTVGINANLTQLDTTTWLSRNSSLEYGMNVEGQSLFVPPDAFYAYYHCDANGKSQKPSPCDKTYDELYEKAASGTDKATRADLFLQLTNRLREMAVVVPFYAQSVLVGVNDKVHGFEANPYEWDNFYNVWVTG